MLNINFNLHSKSEPNKEVVIFAMLRYSADGFRMSLGFMGCPKVKPKNWNSEKQRARGENSKVINFHISRFFREANDMFQKLSEEGTPDKQELKNEIISRITKRKVRIKDNSLESYLDTFIEEGRASKAEGTVKTYTTTKNAFLAYQRYAKRKIDFKHTDYSFVKDFEKYLLGSNKSPNYTHKIIRILKTILKDAAMKGLNEYDYYKQEYFKGKQTPTKEEIYLSESDIQKFYRLELENKKLGNIRDLFLIGCHTGLRYSDLKRLHESNIGTEFITIRTKKTKRDVIIPIHPIVKSILDKHNGKLPRAYSDQYFNEKIKTIGELAKLEGKVNVTYYKGNSSFIKVHPKYELIKTHTARRTFCTNAILAGMPPYQIMKITGHKSLANFEKYIKMSGEEAARLMMGHDFFKNTILKVAK